MPILPIILAGGGGTRLWPLSRGHYPKQFLAVDGEHSLLQQTLLRLADGGTALDVLPSLVVCNEEHRFLVAEQARQLGLELGDIILEPVARNTAPALTAAALHARRQGDDPIFVMMPADHLIADVEEFRRAIATAAEHAASGSVLTFDVVPDRPETGYGYIELGGDGDGAVDATVNRLAMFKEKPDQDTAAAYCASGKYLWNAGLFMMRASVWLACIEQFRPDIHAAVGAAFGAAHGDGDFCRLGRAEFEASPADSIDYAVMEHLAEGEAARALVVSLNAGWSDVGSWASLWEVSPKDAAGNVVRGDVCSIDSKDSLVLAEHRLVATLGCDNLIVAETADAVLVAHKSKTQDVKAIVTWLTEQAREERLTHRRVYRPWGSYESIDMGARFQVKRITVDPGCALSLQMHHHRAEHWIVVAGTAKVTRDDDEYLLSENESTYIPLGAKHRLENPGTIPLELIEVQSGTYLGEDDIVRFEDRYNRAG